MEKKRRANKVDSEYSFDKNDPEQCAVLCHDLLQERSQVLENLVATELRIIDDQVAIGDVPINQFLTGHGLNPIDSNKTPDIALKTGDIVYIGDCAVSQSPAAVRQRKAEKYLPLVDSIKKNNPNIRVEVLYLVLAENGSNIYEIASRIANITGRAISQYRIDDCQRQIAYLNSVKKNIEQNVVNKDKFMEAFTDLTQGDDGLNAFNSFGDGKLVKPLVSTKTDKEIFDKIIDKVMGSEINDIDKQLDNFLEELSNKIDNDNDDAKNIKPLTPIRYIFNYHNKEEKKDHDLLEDYANDLQTIKDSEIMTYLPCNKHIGTLRKYEGEVKRMKIERMNDMSLSTKNFMRQVKETLGVNHRYFANMSDLCRLNKNKTAAEETVQKIKEKNSGGPVKAIRMDRGKVCDNMINKVSKYLATIEEESIPVDNNDIDLPLEPSKKKNEESAAHKTRLIRGRLWKTNAAKYLSGIEQHVQDVTDSKKVLGNGIIYTVPRERTGIILTYTNNNYNSNNPNVYFQSLTRWKLSDFNKHREEIQLMTKGRVHKLEFTKEYVYLLTNLTGFNLDIINKLRYVRREWLIQCMSLCTFKKEYNKDNWREYMDINTGLSAIMMTDLHQNPSVLIDLMKYVLGMIFATHANVKKLLLDKMSIRPKTALDVFLIRRIITYFQENRLSTREFREEFIKKKMSNSTDKYLALKMFKGKSFYNMDYTINDLDFFIQECQTLFQLRPKKLYHSQFIDASAASIVKFNKGTKNEMTKHNIKKIEDYMHIDFDFNDQHMICGSAIANAVKYYEGFLLSKRIKASYSTISKYKSFAIFNASMRGGCKSERMMKKEYDSDIYNLSEAAKERQGKIGYSATALECIIEECEEDIRNGNDEPCRVYNIAKKQSERRQLYNMAEKEQRGGGRPIGSPDAVTKNALLVLEQPFADLGTFVDSNLLAKRVNRAGAIGTADREVMTEAKKHGYNKTYYFVQDQTKFSEGDNIDKFKIMIRNSKLLMPKMKEEYLKTLDNMSNRLQHFPRIPKSLTKEELDEYVEDTWIRGTAGWVQGMLNRISTHFHIMTVEYLTKIFNEFYFKYCRDGEKPIFNINRINSDDSAQFVACDSESTAITFYNFITEGKKMFSLRINDKKSYMSEVMGEIIQKYVIDGSTKNMWIKEAFAFLNNLKTMDPIRDTLSAIGNMSSLYKAGTPEEILVIMRDEYKKEIRRMYHLDKTHTLDSINVDPGKIPIELGGWPKYVSTFELLHAGSFAQLHFLSKWVDTLVKDGSTFEDIIKIKEIRIMLSALKINMIRRKTREEMDKKNIEHKSKKEENVLKKTMLDGSSRKSYKIELMKIANMTRNSDDIEYINEILEETQILKKITEIELSDQDVQTYAMNDNIYDSNMIRSLIGCFSVKIKTNKKIHRTTDLLNSFDYEGTGVGMLFKERMSIQRAIADRRDNAPEDIMKVSEDKITKGPRTIVDQVKRWVFMPTIRIAGIEGSWYLRDALEILSSMSTKLEDCDINIIEQLSRLYSDPTNRAEYAHKIQKNMVIYNTKEKTPVINNRVPIISQDLETANDLQAVLVEIVKPGYLETQGYVFKDPERLDMDKNMIKMLNQSWLSNQDLTVQNAVAMYYQLLGFRIQKYHIGPQMRNDDMYSYMKDTKLKSISNTYEINGSVSKDDDTEEYKNIEGKMISGSANTARLCGFYETVKYLYHNTTMDIEKIKELVDVELIQVEKEEFKTRTVARRMNAKEIKDNLMIEIAFMHADQSEKRALACLYLMLYNDDKLCKKYYNLNQITPEWIKQQELTRVKVNGRWSNSYTGDFKLKLSCGDDAIIISGDPGRIELIETNTLNPETITMLLDYLIKNVRFQGFPFSPSLHWWNTPLARTDNPYTGLKLIKEKDNRPKLITDPVENKTFKEQMRIYRAARVMKVQGIQDLQYEKKMREKYRNYNNFLPIFYDKSMSSAKLKVSNVQNVRCDMESSTVVGTTEVAIQQPINESQHVIKRETQNITVMKMPYLIKSSYFDSIYMDNVKVDGFLMSMITDNGVLKYLVRGQFNELEDNIKVNLFQQRYMKESTIRDFLANEVKIILNEKESLEDAGELFKYVRVALTDDIETFVKCIEEIHDLENADEEKRIEESDMIDDDTYLDNSFNTIDYKKNREKVDIAFNCRKAFIEHANKQILADKTKNVSVYDGEKYLSLLVSRSMAIIVVNIRRLIRRCRLENNGDLTDNQKKEIEEVLDNMINVYWRSLFPKQKGEKKINMTLDDKKENFITVDELAIDMITMYTEKGNVYNLDRIRRAMSYVNAKTILENSKAGYAQTIYEYSRKSQYVDLVGINIVSTVTEKFVKEIKQIKEESKIYTTTSDINSDKTEEMLDKNLNITKAIQGALSASSEEESVMYKVFKIRNKNEAKLLTSTEYDSSSSSIVMKRRKLRKREVVITDSSEDNTDASTDSMTLKNKLKMNNLLLDKIRNNKKVDEDGLSTNNKKKSFSFLNSSDSETDKEKIDKILYRATDDDNSKEDTEEELEKMIQLAKDKVEFLLKQKEMKKKQKEEKSIKIKSYNKDPIQVKRQDEIKKKRILTFSDSESDKTDSKKDLKKPSGIITSDEDNITADKNTKSNSSTSESDSDDAMQFIRRQKKGKIVKREKTDMPEWSKINKTQSELTSDKNKIIKEQIYTGKSDNTIDEEIIIDLSNNSTNYVPQEIIDKEIEDENYKRMERMKKKRLERLAAKQVNEDTVKKKFLTFSDSD